LVGDYSQIQTLQAACVFEQKTCKVSIARNEIETFDSKSLNLKCVAMNSMMQWGLDMANRNIKKNSSALSKKNKFDAVLSAVAQSVHKSLELHEVLDSAVESIAKNMDNVDNVSIYLVEGDRAVLKAHIGYSDKFVEKAGTIPYPKGFTWNTIIEGKSRYVADIEQDTLIGPAGRELGTKSYFSIPIHFQTETVGVININSLSKDAFNEDDLNLFEIVAQQVEVAFNNSNQAEILKQSERKLAQRNCEIEEAYSKLEQQSIKMIQMEKMISIGTMVGGIAHELNNPFMGIINFTDYCLKLTLMDDKRYALLKHVQDQVNHCVDIVNNLLTFSRIEEEGPETRQEESCTVIFDRIFKLLSYRINW
jgi:putative methionine-R-sulfoxide reductase with GAF domain